MAARVNEKRFERIMKPTVKTVSDRARGRRTRVSRKSGAARDNGSHAGFRKRVIRIQRLIGVREDGWVGPETLSRLETLLAPMGLPLTGAALTASTRSLDALVAFEISSPRYYEKHLASPVWPGGESGVTIGIGYDLGTVTTNEFAADWRAYLAGADMVALSRVVGRQGAQARNTLTSVNSVVVTFEAAEKVFYLTTLPEVAMNTRRLYPGTEKLPPDAAGALVSLVYNRGTRLEGDTRKEMKAIRALVPNIDLTGIAVQLRSMKRLWDPDELPGLIARREAEAVLVEQAMRPYLPDELVRI
jgi:GH24 family phage-related lysozyme (muramidase)